MDNLSEKFRNYLWKLSHNLLELIKENQGNVVVRLMKVIEVEEQADLRVLNMEQIRTSNMNLASSGEFKSLKENPREIRNYRSQCFSAIHDSIAENFMVTCIFIKRKEYPNLSRIYLKHLKLFVLYLTIWLWFQMNWHQEFLLNIRY